MIRCEGYPIRITYDKERVFTVFPADSYYLPQDFPSYEAALEYAKTLDCNYEIEEAQKRSDVY